MSVLQTVVWGTAFTKLKRGAPRMRSYSMKPRGPVPREYDRNGSIAYYEGIGESR